MKRKKNIFPHKKNSTIPAGIALLLWRAMGCGLFIIVMTPKA
jgi:hypothetical protein